MSKFLATDACLDTYWVKSLLGRCRRYGGSPKDYLSLLSYGIVPRSCWIAGAWCRSSITQKNNDETTRGELAADKLLANWPTLAGVVAAAQQQKHLMIPNCLVAPDDDGTGN